MRASGVRSSCETAAENRRRASRKSPEAVTSTSTASAPSACARRCTSHRRRTGSSTVISRSTTAAPPSTSSTSGAQRGGHRRVRESRRAAPLERRTLPARSNCTTGVGAASSSASQRRERRLQLRPRHAAGQLLLQRGVATGARGARQRSRRPHHEQGDATAGSSFQDTGGFPRRQRPHRFFTDRCPARFPLPTGRTGYLDSVASVLVIEDDAVVARVMLQHLRHAGFDVEWVEDGERGLTQAALRAARRAPSST